MQRTITIRVPFTRGLVRTVEAVNNATNDIVIMGAQEGVVNKLKLHHLSYYPIRKKYPDIPANFVTAARDVASEMLKSSKRRLPVKRRWSAVRYNQRTFSGNLSKGTISLSSVEGRIHLNVVIPECYRQYIDWKPVAARLSFDGVRLILGMVMEIDAPSVQPTKTVLGVDTGILNHAVLSNNLFYSSSHIRAVKGCYQHIRGELQAKGTRSARRKLKRMSGGERRFMADANHQIAKWIVAQPFDAIALEKLNVTRDKRLGLRFNKALGNWAFGQLRNFIDYKAEAIGKAVFHVNPCFTSQTCSKCGHSERKNRSGPVFKCRSCGFELHSDLNASRNIASLGTSEVGRSPVNRPNVSRYISVHSGIP